MSLEILLSIYLFFILLEALFPRKKGIFFQKRLLLDVGFVAINAFIFWEFWPDLSNLFLQTFPNIPQISLWSLPTVVQGAIVIVIMDFLSWWGHRALHTFPVLWRIHKTHHSIEELHFLRVLYYNPLENIYYAVIRMAPLVIFQFNPVVWLFIIPIEAIIGMWNHSNTSLRLPKWIAYVINTPQVHIWHHDELHPKRSAKNFGILFTFWDFIFGTLYYNEVSPKEIGTKEKGTLYNRASYDF